MNKQQLKYFLINILVHCAENNIKTLQEFLNDKK
jgi:hypothetical protein